MFRLRPFLFSFLLLVSLTSFRFSAQTVRPEVERAPHIDVLDYQVEVELEPPSHRLKAKATVKFIPLEDSIRSVIFDFNANMKLKRVYFTDKPPAPGETQLTESNSEILSLSGSNPSKRESAEVRIDSGDSNQSEAPRLTRRGAKQRHRGDCRQREHRPFFDTTRGGHRPQKRKKEVGRQIESKPDSPK